MSEVIFKKDVILRHGTPGNLTTEIHFIKVVSGFVQKHKCDSQAGSKKDSSCI
jgi:hypothetical protein